MLVHGGCHDGSLWQPVIERLEQFGHTAYAPTVAGHGKGVPKNVTHAETTQSIVDFIVDKDLTDFILVGHGYAGTIISKVVEVIPERVRRLVFWSAYVLNDGESALEMLPDTIEMITQMAADSDDNTFNIPFECGARPSSMTANPILSACLRPAFLRALWAMGRAAENGEVPFASDSTQLPRRDEDMVVPPGDLGARMSSRLGEFRLVQMPGSHEAIFTIQSALLTS